MRKREREREAAAIVGTWSLEDCRRDMLTRQVVLAGAIAGAGGCLSRGSRPLARGRGRDATVLVVGGGLAGLAVVHLLVKRGMEVTVLEATERPGGRVLTLRAPWRDGLFVEAGATHVVPQPDLLARCAELQVALERRPSTGGLARVTVFGGSRRVTRPADAVGLVHAAGGRGGRRGSSALRLCGRGRGPGPRHRSSAFSGGARRWTAKRPLLRRRSRAAHLSTAVLVAHPLASTSVAAPAPCRSTTERPIRFVPRPTASSAPPYRTPTATRRSATTRPRPPPSPNGSSA